MSDCGDPPAKEEPAAVYDPASDPTLSKSARKKLLKRQMKDEMNRERKQQRKDQSKAEAARRREESNRKFDSMTEEEKEAKREHTRTLVDSRRERAALKKKHQAEALANGRGLVLDLEFGDLMSQKEHKSLMSQLMYCYSTNTRASTPCKMILTGISGDTKSLYDAILGTSNWKVHVHEKPYIEVFQDRKDELVYLTADSANEITTLDPTKTYIIGAIVDHNRYKNLTLEKAEKQGIAHARLPIGPELKLRMSSVLTVNQVVEIILNYFESNDWIESLSKAIPSRKRARDSDDESKDTEIQTSKCPIPANISAHADTAALQSSDVPGDAREACKALDDGAQLDEPTK
mmetsp:Transcript_47837/g.89062  ORF Transcript_47837/g.89062 Transcript_47837/m.89062 type:complete len:347 (-) Transcript_47837:206-1246(-)